MAGVGDGSGVFSYYFLKENKMDKLYKNDKGIWNPDLENGCYRNPIIYADYSDPDVVRVGEDFYMVSSSFNCMPGIPVLHSTDLVNWRLVNHVVPKLPFDCYDTPQHGKGVWAPSIVLHDDKVWVYFCTPDEGLFMSYSSDPKQNWSPLCHVKQARGMIDPFPFWDEDGNAYLLHAYAKSRTGYNNKLNLCRMSPDGTSLYDLGVQIFDGDGLYETMEGPKLYKKDGWYYITAPAGGITHGHQVVLRSRQLYGEYEHRMVLHEGNSGINGPRQGGIAALENGEYWFVHFRDLGAYGRVVNLQPVNWEKEWPVIGIEKDSPGIGEPVAEHRKPGTYGASLLQVPATSDDFSQDRLGLQWQWYANPGEGWYSLTERPDFLRLYAIGMPAFKGLYHCPNLLLQKLPAPAFTVTVKIQPSLLTDGDRAGMILTGSAYSFLEVALEEGKEMLRQWKGLGDDTGAKEWEVASAELDTAPGKEIYLRISLREGAEYRFSYSRDGRSFIDFGEGGTAEKELWIGAKLGLFCINARGLIGTGFVDVDWFEIRPVL